MKIDADELKKYILKKKEDAKDMFDLCYQNEYREIVENCDFIIRKINRMVKAEKKKIEPVCPHFNVTVDTCDNCGHKLTTYDDLIDE